MSFLAATSRHEFLASVTMPPHLLPDAPTEAARARLRRIRSLYARHARTAPSVWSIRFRGRQTSHIFLAERCTRGQGKSREQQYCRAAFRIERCGQMASMPAQPPPHSQLPVYRGMHDFSGFYHVEVGFGDASHVRSPPTNAIKRAGLRGCVARFDGARAAEKVV